MTNYLDIALSAFKPGEVHLIPVNSDKTPACKWKDYQESQTEEDIKRLFSRPCWGMAMLTGVGYLEVIDIDSKHWEGSIPLHDDYITTVGGLLSAPIVAQKTISGGMHLLYRSYMVEGNLKLAKSNGKTVIETRGEGGYVVVAPTPGYEWTNGDLTVIPFISDDDRESLMQVAKSYGDEEEVIEPKPANLATSGTTPADGYNNKHNWRDMLHMLEVNGWSQVKEDSKRIYLRRPGKDRGSHSGDILKDRNLFKNWSSNALGGEEATYSAFGLYAQLNHNGDYSAAAKALYEDGYGDRVVPTSTIEPVKVERMRARRVTEDEEEIEFTWHYNTHSGREIPIAGPGSIVVITGDTGAGKSTIQDLMCATALAGKKFLGLSINLKGGKIARFDTEQETFWLKLSNRRVLKMAGLHRETNRFDYLSVEHLYKVAEKVAEIDAYLEENNNVSLLMIDNIVDLLGKVNDEEASLNFVNKLKAHAKERGYVLVVVLHETRSSGLAQGWLGKIFEQRAAWVIRMKAEKTSDGIEVYTAQNRKKRGEPFNNIQFIRGPHGEIIEYSHSVPDYGRI